MQFTPIELSKKLVALGCRSESQSYHCSETCCDILHSINLDGSIQTFCLEDFVGQSKVARENATILANIGMPIKAVAFRPEDEGCQIKQDAWDKGLAYRTKNFRHTMIDHPNGWVDFLEKYLNNR